MDAFILVILELIALIRDFAAVLLHACVTNTAFQAEKALASNVPFMDILEQISIEDSKITDLQRYAPQGATNEFLAKSHSSLTISDDTKENSSEEELTRSRASSCADATTPRSQ